MIRGMKLYHGSTNGITGSIAPVSGSDLCNLQRIYGIISNMNLQPIPKDTGSFLSIRNAGQLYVDKTAYLHRLIASTDKCFFIARPRRFGKSLMITTLKEIFNGRRDLFEGLAIAKTDYIWRKHPVLHFNFGFCAEKTSYEDFDRAFAIYVRDVLAETGYEYNDLISPGANFGRAIDMLAAKAYAAAEAEKAAGRDGTPLLPVILIDEYDDPVAKTLDRVNVAEDVRNRMASFYGQFKDRTEKYRFLMITGVSKFTKMSVFSALSNLIDLSFEDEYATMLGYTEAELDEYFTDRMQIQAEKMGMTYEAYREELRRMYNGYRFFLEEGEKVYNPVSINLDLADCKGRFRCYWTSTRRPSSLMNVIKRGDMLAIDPEKIENVSAADFDVTDLRNLKPVAMLYQTGYLTIKNYVPGVLSGIYELCVPDEEVRADLSLVFASLHADKDVAWAANAGVKLLTGDFKSFFIALKSLYAGVAYGSTEDSVHEASFARNLQFLLAGQGFRMTPERTTADGRIDLVADHPCGTYIFELKVDKPAAIAMSQAEAKAYAEPYLAPDKPIWLIGLSFERDTRKFLEGVYERVGGAA